MAKERLSKLQKWILTACYLKTVKDVRPDGWKNPRDYKYYVELDRKRAENEPDYKGIWKPIGKYLFKAEVMLNYFGLTPSHKEPWCSNGVREKFRTTKAYKAALVSFSRTIKRLYEKRYIEIWTHINRWTGIELTGLGREKAKVLLNC